MTTAPVDPAFRTTLEWAARNNDAAYADFVAKWPLEYYKRRLQQIDLTGYGHVLDVGSGFGQWLAALSMLNDRATGIDIHVNRVKTSQTLIEDLWLPNATSLIGSAVEIPFEDNTFDALFCYGVFMFVDRAKALAEFRRVLKPGGVIYVCTNARGWWLKLALTKLGTNRDVAKVGWQAFRRGRKGGIPNATDLFDVKPLLEACGFTDVVSGGEGTLTADGTPTKLASHYPGTFLGYDCVIEFLARKPVVAGGLAARRSPSAGLAAHIVQQTVLRKTYSFVKELGSFIVDDSEELVYGTKPSVVSLAKALSEGEDQAAFLTNVTSAITAPTMKPQDKARAVVIFAQTLFYHHFAAQPMDGKTLLVNPIEVVVFRACRCGSAARLVVDLMQTMGFDARLVGGACHTAAEAFIDGSWRLLEASLYPPGIVPVGQDGELLRTSDAIAEPDQLDKWPSYINYHVGHVAAFKKSYPKAVNQIEHYLNFPILPSVGYFGEEFAGERAGRLTRYRKVDQKQGASSWINWDSVVVDEQTPAPRLQTYHRPEQVVEARRSGDELVWVPARTLRGEAVIYEVYFSAVARGWDYGELTVGATFELVGTRQWTRDNCIALPDDIRRDGGYVTLIAKLADNPDAFHLPSDEFRIQPEAS